MVVISLSSVLEKKYTNSEDRLRDIIKRLEALPQILEQGQENLDNPPDLRMRLAAQKAQIAYNSFGEFSADLYKMAKAEQTQQKVKESTAVAKEALKKYADFLRETLEKKEYTDFRLGEENYAILLKDVYFLSEPVSKYQKIIEQEVEDSQTFLKSLLAPYLLDILSEDEKAQRTDDKGALIILPSDYYLVRNAKFAQTPTVGEIAPTYASLYQKASQYFAEKEIFAIPDLALSLQRNPQYLRQPYTPSLYLAPYPFATRQNADLFLNIPTEEDKNALVNLFTYSDIKIDVAQKLFPGINLSYNATLDDQQVLKIISDDMFYINGWASYALTFAQKEGFFEDDADNLNIAWLKYKRALYALADIKMQTKELNYTQTLDMLISSGINDEEATEAVDFLAVNPAEALSYIIGSKEFERLNSKYQKKLKDKFSQLEFNNKILSLGRVPLNVLAEGLEQAYKTKPIESFFNTMYF